MQNAMLSLFRQCYTATVNVTNTLQLIKYYEVILGVALVNQATFKGAFTH